MSDRASPYGGNEVLIEELPVGWLIHEYQKRSGVDVSGCFAGVDRISLYECSKTGYRYWEPFSIAGNEAFYTAMASSTHLYYPRNRWEYSMARNMLNKKDDVLDISCGRGFFLKSIEGSVRNWLGLEFSQYAIENKITAFPIRIGNIQDLAGEGSKFDVVCSFQVLEHVTNPKEFIQGCLDVLKPGGKLVLSTPNYASVVAQSKSDCWDLPPHHMGHYSEETYQKIGEMFGLKLLAVYQEPRGEIEIPATSSTRKKLAFRVFRKLFALASRLVFRLSKEPGHTIVAIFERHA